MYKMKNGSEYEIRKAKKEDAEIILDYIDCISGESDNLSFGVGEFDMSLQKEMNYLEAVSRDENQINILAVYDGMVIGNLSYSGGPRPRNRHRGEFGISVRKKFWNNGVGNALMIEMINWAERSKYCEKINLKVNEDNLNAIALYEKFGFVKEGLLLKDMKINGRYVNCVFMGITIKK